MYDLNDSSFPSGHAHNCIYHFHGLLLYNIFVFVHACIYVLLCILHLKSIEPRLPEKTVLCCATISWGQVLKMSLLSQMPLVSYILRYVANHSLEILHNCCFCQLLPLTQPQLPVNHYGLCVCQKSALSFHAHDLIWAQTWPLTRLLSLVCKCTPLWVLFPLWSPVRCVSDTALVWHWSIQHSSLVPNPVFYTIWTSCDCQNLFESGLTQLIPNGLISFPVSPLLGAQSKPKSVIPDSIFFSKGMMCF